VLVVTSIFLCLILILNLLEEVNFFKDLEVFFLFPFLMSLLKASSNLFEIFPFIVMISTQFFFLELISKNELEALKINGVNNLKLIKILFFSSFFLGLVMSGFFYNISAKLNFFYLEMKNSYSEDNDYLLVVNKNGIWIKDEIDEKTYIINASELKGSYLIEVIITEFDKDFKLQSVIKSLKVDISNFDWEILMPIINKDNVTKRPKESVFIRTHFDQKKINSLYENLSSLTIFELINLKKDYVMIGYSTNEIESKIQKIISFPTYLTILVMLISIIMLNIKRNNTFIFHVILGIFLSVVIYYFYYLFNLLGENNTIPILTSVWLPLVILLFIVIIGLIRINEK
jgi:lipopolysaccharide export system permease protein